jgi:AcrR family transcriptional regulator
MPLDASKTGRSWSTRPRALIDITRRAGQRNRGALHYHFGSRNGVLCAVLGPARGRIARGRDAGRKERPRLFDTRTTTGDR